MANSRIAPRQAAKKPRPRKTLKKATAKRAMPLRTRDPVRTVQMKSHDAKPTKRKRAETNGREGLTVNNSATPSSGLFTMLMQWSPLGIFLRQQAFFAGAMSQAAQTSRR
jgi:hypothetical protein